MRIGPRSRSPYPIALRGHALGVDAIVSRLQRAAGGVRIAGADGTARNQAGTGAQRRPLPYMSRRRSDRRAGKRTERRADGRSSNRGLIGCCAGRLVADRLLRRTLAVLIVPLERLVCLSPAGQGGERWNRRTGRSTSRTGETKSA